LSPTFFVAGWGKLEGGGFCDLVRTKVQLAGDVKSVLLSFSIADKKTKYICRTKMKFREKEDIIKKNPNNSQLSDQKEMCQNLQV
jgi:hypothetical protein